MSNLISGLKRNNPDAHYHQAWLDYFKQDIDGAISHFERAVAQNNLNSTLRVRALCKLALLYASLDNLKQADTKVREAVNLLSSSRLETERELATLVDMTVFAIDQAHAIAGRMTELSKPAPYLGIDVQGEVVLTVEKLDEWFDSVNQGYTLLDFRNTKAFLNTSRNAIELSERESVMIDMLMRAKSAISTRRFLDSVWDEEDFQPSVVKTAVNRIRRKLESVFDKPYDVIKTTEIGYEWNQRYSWKIIKYTDQS